MAVPEKLKQKAHVFCFSSDLIDASIILAEYLNCEVSKVYDGHFDPEFQTSIVAWLVGHGSKINTIVGNSDGSFGYKISIISEWLKTYKRNYSSLVDTCCYPNMRKRFQLFGHDYYCSDDDMCVQVITSYPSFDNWWDQSHMHQYLG